MSLAKKLARLAQTLLYSYSQLILLTWNTQPLCLGKELRSTSTKPG